MVCLVLLLVLLVESQRAVSITMSFTQVTLLINLPGRNWEGFSPDPYLTGVLFAETVKGIQSTGQMAVAKHFLFNEYESPRPVGDRY